MATYIVYSGNGKVSPSASESFIEASSVATLYGLEEADYEIGDETSEEGTAYGYANIHLRPRPDGKYINIKNELGDNGTDTHYRDMVDPRRWRQRNRDINDYRTRF